MSDLERKTGAEIDDQERERKLAYETEDEVDGHVPCARTSRPTRIARAAGARG